MERVVEIEESQRLNGEVEGLLGSEGPPILGKKEK